MCFAFFIDTIINCWMKFHFFFFSSFSLCVFQFPDNTTATHFKPASDTSQQQLRDLYKVIFVETDTNTYNIEKSATKIIIRSICLIEIISIVMRLNWNGKYFQTKSDKQINREEQDKRGEKEIERVHWSESGWNGIEKEKKIKRTCKLCEKKKTNRESQWQWKSFYIDCDRCKFTLYLHCQSFISLCNYSWATSHMH